jgi:mannose-6-phosphate isomerase-like protein (cupin superfamily)
MGIPPGEAEGSPENRHRGADQSLYVVSGTGSALVNGQRYPLRPGTLPLIEYRDKHEIKNTGHELLRTLNIYVPTCPLRIRKAARSCRRSNCR